VKKHQEAVASPEKGGQWQRCRKSIFPKMDIYYQTERRN
jgi:hypothetical protein